MLRNWIWRARGRKGDKEASRFTAQATGKRKLLLTKMEEAAGRVGALESFMSEMLSKHPSSCVKQAADVQVLSSEEQSKLEQ